VQVDAKRSDGIHLAPQPAPGLRWSGRHLVPRLGDTLPVLGRLRRAVWHRCASHSQQHDH
jgi:hypothetical protein